MSSGVSEAFPPVALRRIALVNPTKFLGNLLIAGGLIQQFAAVCRQRDIALLLVIDERYRTLLQHAFPGVELVCYPRHVLQRPARPAAWRAFAACVARIRAFRADLAFTLDEDSVAHRLTHLSGAAWRVSSTPARYHMGFHAVLPVERSGRHAWFSYREVFERLGLADGLPTRPCYLNLSAPPLDKELRQSLDASGQGAQRPLAILHAGATKTYKMWPASYYAELAGLLLDYGYQVALIGAGQRESDINQRIMAQVRRGRSNEAAIDLCDRLDLVQLAAVLGQATCVAGNDSGPVHLAAALGVPGAVIFGPTDQTLWRPLSTGMQVVENTAACDPRCRRGLCLRDHACLRGIMPDTVFSLLTQTRLADRRQPPV